MEATERNFDLEWKTILRKLTHDKLTTLEDSRFRDT